MIRGIVDFVRAYPLRASWYGMLVLAVYVQAQMVPHSIARLAQDAWIQAALYAYGLLAVGVAAAGAELVRLQVNERNFDRVVPSALLFAIAAVCCVQADLVTWGRESNARAVAERAAFVASSNKQTDASSVRSQIAALDASAGPAGLLKPDAYQAQIEAKERSRASSWGSRLRSLDDEIARLQDMKGRAERRDALKETLNAVAPATGATSGPPARDPSRDWQLYIDVVGPIVAIFGIKETMTPEKAQALFSWSLAVLGGLLPPLGLWAAGKRRERKSPASPPVAHQEREPLPPVNVSPPPRLPPPRVERPRLSVVDDDDVPSLAAGMAARERELRRGTRKPRK